MPASSRTGRGSSCSARSPTRVSEHALPETVVLVEHPPVVTIGRRTEQEKELHVPDAAEVELVETDRGGKSTYHAPGQLVCYPILDLGRHGKDVSRYVRELERGDRPDPCRLRAGCDDDRRADRCLAAARWCARAAEDRLDRRSGLALGDDARLRAQRRPRSRSVHRVDHRLRPRRCRVHDDVAGARQVRCGRRREAGRARCPRPGLRARARRAAGSHPRGPRRPDARRVATTTR